MASNSTLYAEGSPSYPASADITQIPALASLDNNTASERIQLRRVNSGSGAPSTVIVDGGVVQANIGLTGVTWPAADDNRKMIVAYTLNDAMPAHNGVLGSGDPAVTLPTPTQLQIGNGAGIGTLNGYIKRVAYWNTRLPNATLQSHTTP